MLATIIVSLITLIVGLLIARYYYRKTFQRSLSPFIHMCAPILLSIDPAVRQELKVSFHDQAIDELTHFQLLIANTGSRAIRDCIRPLTIKFPEGSKILDHSILHRTPSDLELQTQVTTDDRRVDTLAVQFVLLNPGEYFLLRMLVQGILKPFDVECGITVDDLPRKLSLEFLDPAATTKEKPKWAEFFAGAALVLMFVGFAYLAYLLLTPFKALFVPSLDAWMPDLIRAAASVLVVVFLFLVCIVGIALMTGNPSRLWKQSPKFPLPDDLRPVTWLRFYPEETMSGSERKEVPKKAE